MTEKLGITKQINYQEDIGEHCSVDLDAALDSDMSDLAVEALSANRFFKKLQVDKQKVAIRSLSLMGSMVESMNEGAWNYVRWADEWTTLEQEDASLVIDSAIRETSEPIIREGFRNMFSMMQAGVTTVDELREKRAKSKLNTDVTLRDRASGVIGTSYATRGYHKKYYRPRPWKP